MVKDSTAYWTVRDVAEYLGMKKQTIYNMVHSRKIPFHKIGLKSVRFKKDEIDSWVEEYKSRDKSRIDYIIKDGHPRIKIDQPDDEYFSAKDVAKEALASYQYYSGKFRISFIKNEIYLILSNRIVVPSAIIKNKEFFTHFDLGKIVGLIIIATESVEVPVDQIEDDRKEIYETFMEAIRRNADELSFSPENVMSDEEKAYRREDVVGTIIDQLKEITLGFIKRKSIRSDIASRFVDLGCFMKAFLAGFIYFLHNDYIDGHGDRENDTFILKERELDKLSPLMIKNGLEFGYFVKDELIQPLEEHVKELEIRVRELKKMVRSIKK